MSEMGANEFIILFSTYLGWIAAPAIPICLLRAIKKIHQGNDDYIPELAILVICSLILWGRAMV